MADNVNKHDPGTTRRGVLQATLPAILTGAVGLSFVPKAQAQSKPKSSTEKVKPSTSTAAGFTTANSLVLLVDHQTGTVGWVKSLPKETVVTTCRVLTKMALEYKLPLFLTTTMEEYVGPTIKDLQDLAPQAFAGRYKRGGQLSCWDDPALASAVAASGRQHIILAGLTTDICLFWAALHAIKLGYTVMVVADACGTMTPLGDQLTYDRLRQAGATITVVNQAVTELVSNFGTPEGQKAQKIMADEIISKL